MGAVLPLVCRTPSLAQGSLSMRGSLPLLSLGGALEPAPLVVSPGAPGPGKGGTVVASPGLILSKPEAPTLDGSAT